MTGGWPSISPGRHKPSLTACYLPKQVVVSLEQIKHGLAVATVRTLYRFTSLGGPAAGAGEVDMRDNGVRSVGIVEVVVDG